MAIYFQKPEVVEEIKTARQMFLAGYFFKIGAVNSFDFQFKKAFDPGEEGYIVRGITFYCNITIVAKNGFHYYNYIFGKQIKGFVKFSELTFIHSISI